MAFLFSVSLALEAWSVGRARRAVEALMTLTPDTARVLRPDGSEVTLPASEVNVGDTLVIRPGEKFPLDGRVLKGETTVNQALLDHQTQIECENIETVIGTFQRFYCENCHHRSPKAS